MAEAPSTSTYLLLSPDFDSLPNARALRVEPSSGLVLEDSGPENFVTLNTQANLAKMNTYNQSGYMTYDSATQEFVGRSLTSDNTIIITNPNGATGITEFGVRNNSCLQQVQTAQSGLLLSQRSRLNFIPSANISIGVTDTAESTDIYFDVQNQNTGTVTYVGLTSPQSTLAITGSPITTYGVFTADLVTQVEVEPGSYTNPIVTVNTKGIITDIVEGNPGPDGRGRVVNVDPSLSPYYVTDEDFVINVTRLESEQQMVVVLPAVNVLRVGKQYIIKDSSFQNTISLYTHVVVASETEEAFSITGAGTIQAGNGDQMSWEFISHIDFTGDTTMTFTGPSTEMLGPLDTEGGNIDNQTFFNITNPGGCLNVVGLNNVTNTWAIT